MSQPDNATSGKYFLRSGKLSPPSSPPGHASLVDDTVPKSFVIVAQPSPSARLDFTNSGTSAFSTSSPVAFSLNTTVDSDSESEMSSNSTLTPAAFTGRPSEDILEFLKNFELWTVFRRMADESKLGALPLFLKDSAAVWYNTQPRNVKGDLTELRHALIDRYGPSATYAWKRAADLWKMRQQSSQTTDDFITSIQQVAQKLDIPSEQTFMVALSGLRPNIRQHVIQHDPKSMEDIQKWGRVTEISQEDSTEAAQHLRDTVSELTILKDELKQLKLTSIASINTQSTRSRSPTLHRGSFANPPHNPPPRPSNPQINIP